MGELQGSAGTTITFEACTEFRGSHDDLLVCSCGWLEDDHVVETLAVVTPVRRRRPQITLPERRAS
jgi:hypothetical protein